MNIKPASARSLSSLAVLPAARADAAHLASSTSLPSPRRSSKKGSSPTSWLCSRMMVRSRRERLCSS